jgi:GT2 family glycosyltransferase
LGQGVDTQVVLAVDNNQELFDLARERYPLVTTVLNEGERGASATRNTGARAATGQILAFLDDDAEAMPGWLESLTRPLRTDAGVIGVGGWVDPSWPGTQPAWFPMEFGWVVGASYIGLPPKAGVIRNVWSENMAVRKADFFRVGGFLEGFGKKDNSSRPEDTELCLRMAAQHPGTTWWFEPSAVIKHHVPPGRSTLRFFLRRCVAEGAGKARLAELAGRADALSTEQSYATKTLPLGVLRGLGQPFTGRIDGPLRSVAIVAGLTAAVLGYLREIVTHRFSAAHPVTADAESAGIALAAIDSTERGPGVPPITRPARILEVDLATPVPALPPPPAGEPSDMLLVVSLCGRPIGMVEVTAPATPDSVSSSINALNDLVRQEALLHEISPTPLTSTGLVHDRCPIREARSELESNGPGITVALCTRDRPAELRRALQSLALIEYHNVEIMVVDNAPADNRSESVCQELSTQRPIHYILEPVAGLSAARNRALAEAKYDLIAFIDDDERVDPHWLSALAAEFVADPAVGAVGGLVLPADLSGMPQVRFEQFGGHSKGRGFRRVVFDAEYLRKYQSPYFPKPPFGVGANMAFDVGVLREIGGFDAALGAGTRTKGAEDTLAFSEVLLTGRTMVYTPAALTWHYHRADDSALHEQLSGYTLGLGAFYISLALRSPRRVIALGRLAFALARDAVVGRVGGRVGRSSLPAVQTGDASVSSARRMLGMLRGPFAYALSRRDVRRRISDANRIDRT